MGQSESSALKPNLSSVIQCQRLGPRFFHVLGHAFEKRPKTNEEIYRPDPWGKLSINVEAEYILRLIYLTLFV